MPRRAASPARASPARTRTPKASKSPRSKSPGRSQSADANRAVTNADKTGYAFDEEPPQFGGALGVGTVIVFSHILLYYFYLSLELHGGALFLPQEAHELIKQGFGLKQSPFLTGDFVWTQSRTLEAYWTHLADSAVPTAETCAVYAAFIAFQTALALLLPGFIISGLPVASLGGKRLKYNCNGCFAWWVTQGVAAYLHYNGVFRVQWIADHYGALLTTMVVFGDAVAIAVYAAGFLRRVPGEGHPGAFRKERMTGSHVYDFFMGASLNPRVKGPLEGGLDIKMWAEVRVSWITLFLITCSAALKQYETTGTLSSGMALMLMAHWLYTNACVKGEECIVPTWDIAHEKWGWMLCFWNLAGVPVMYTFNSMYLLHNCGWSAANDRCADQTFSQEVTALMFAGYLFVYYVWDTCNSQKNNFRAVLQGTYEARPWCVT
jgi:delta24(24(1))-sterol reductase